MLVRFTVGNFCSFDKNQTLSLIAGSYQNNKDRLFIANDFKILKFATLFGANASGKSNFIKAIEYASSLIITDTDNYYINKNKDSFFKLNSNNKNKPSYFEFEILIDNELYAYGFEIILSENRITEEWLIKLNKTKDEEIFTRNTNTEKSYFNEKYITPENSQRLNIYLEDFKKVTNRLFLANLNSNKEELYKSNSLITFIPKIFEWISNLDISYPNTPVSGYSCLNNDNYEELLEALKSFKTGISNIKTTEISKEIALEKTPENFRKKIEDEINKIKELKEIRKVIRLNINGRLIFISIADKVVFTEISFEHFGINDINFSLSEESDGTQRLLDSLSIFFTKKEQSVFVIDEIDRSLHPQLTIQFIQSFLEFAKKKNIQLIITSHESHLLNLKLLRQDEIFFVEVKKMGNSELYPFDKFKERFDKKIEQAYLEGRYGAVPLFDKIFEPFKPIE